jgi:hypothetical protein
MTPAERCRAMAKTAGGLNVTEIQRAGAVAAALMAALYAFVIVAFLAIAPALGITDADLTDPIKNIELARDKPLGAFVIYGTFFFVGLAVLVVAHALEERLGPRSASLSRLAYMALVVSVGANALEATSPTVMTSALIPYLASDPKAAAGANLGVMAVSTGLHVLGFAMLGVWMLLISIISVRKGGLPRATAWFGFVPGALGIASFIALDATRPLFFLTAIVWFIALARVFSGATAPARALDRRAT